MEEQKKISMPLFAKIAIGINVLLFGITGIYYMVNNSYIIGGILLAAGVLNIIYSLITIKTNNHFFVGLNFLFAIAAFIVCLDFLILRSQTESTIGVVWMIITMVYLVVAFILLGRVKKGKSVPPTDG